MQCTLLRAASRAITGTSISVTVISAAAFLAARRCSQGPKRACIGLGASHLAVPVGVQVSR
jgi:hypothetical protein